MIWIYFAYSAFSISFLEVVFKRKYLQLLVFLTTVVTMGAGLALGTTLGMSNIYLCNVSIFLAYFWLTFDCR